MNADQFRAAMRASFTPRECDCGHHIVVNLRGDVIAAETTVTIPRGTSHLRGVEVDALVTAGKPLPAGGAAAVASWWQGPDPHGRVFAALVSHFPVTLADLFASIADARSIATEPEDLPALAALEAWALAGAAAA